MGRIPLLLALALVPRSAQGQDGFDAHGLYLAPLDGDPRDLVTVQRPGRMIYGDGYAGAVVEVLQDAPRIGTLPELEGQIVLNTAAGVVLNERARLDVAAPIFLATTGPDTPDDAKLGDVRVSSQILLVEPGITRSGGLGLGVVPWVTLPSGPEEEGLGQEGLAGGAFVNGTWEWPAVTLTGEVGLGFQPEEDLPGQDHAVGGLGLSYQALERTAIAVEGRAYLRLVDEWQDAGIPAELLFSVRQVSARGPHVLAGAGVGVTEGIGVPDWRVFIGGGFGRRQDPDPDQDLSIGALDLCPDEPEDFNGYEDLDGCPDVLATLAIVPLLPGGEAMLEASVVVSNEEVTLGEGRAPAVFRDLIPGETWAAAARRACWAGEVENLVLREGENVIAVPMRRALTADLRFVVVDARDVPIEDVLVRWLADGPNCSPLDLLELPVGLGSAEVGAGQHRILVSAPGYASRTFVLEVPEGFDQNVELELVAPQVDVVDGALVTSDRVWFEVGRAQVLPYGEPVLDRAAEILLARPELGAVEIVGSAEEGDAFDEALSLRRAMAVRDYLVAAGLPEERVVVRGLDRAPVEGPRIELGLEFAEIRPTEAGSVVPGRPET